MSYCIYCIEYVTLYLSHCICHIVHLSLCICHIVSITLYLSYCIYHTAFYSSPFSQRSKTRLQIHERIRDGILPKRHEHACVRKRTVNYCNLRGTTVVSVFLLAVTQCVHLCQPIGIQRQPLSLSSLKQQQFTALFGRLRKNLWKSPQICRLSLRYVEEMFQIINNVDSHSKKIR